MTRVRTNPSSPLLSVLVLGVLALTACGDGIDERTHPLEPQRDAVTTTAPEPIVLPTFEVERSELVIDDTEADYSGAHSALRLADGTWLFSGYDDHSTFGEPEPGALWRGDLSEVARVGEDLSDEKGQQVIASLTELASGRVLAAGTNFSRDDPEADFYLYDASVWLSDDQGTTFRQVSLQQDAAVAGALVIDGSIFVHGYQFAAAAEGVATGQIWYSDDDGESWRQLDPTYISTPGAAPTSLGTIDQLLIWEGSLIAIGRVSATDPDGSDYPLDRYSLSSSTEQWEPIDLALWYSDDLGASWHDAPAQGLAGLADAQVPTAAAVVGDQLVIAGSASEASPEFDLDDSDPDDSDLDDSELGGPAMLPTIWTCDYPLQRCESVTVVEDGSEFVNAMVVEHKGLAFVAFSGFTDGDSDGEQLLAFDPLSGEFTLQALPAAFEQTSAIVVDGDRLVLCGRDSGHDELAILLADIVG